MNKKKGLFLHDDLNHSLKDQRRKRSETHFFSAVMKPKPDIYFIITMKCWRIGTSFAEISY
jgi:hypothetical protein